LKWRAYLFDPIGALAGIGFRAISVGEGQARWISALVEFGKNIIVRIFTFGFTCAGLIFFAIKRTIPHYLLNGHCP
jgi:hypothetical protein